MLEHEKQNEAQQKRTPEELKEEKIKAFNENPDMFLDKRLIIACAAKLPDGSVGIILQKAPISMLYMAKGKLDTFLTKGILIAQEAEMAHKSRIVRPGENRNKLRRFLNGKGR